VSLLVVVASEAEQEVSLGRELLDEGRSVPEVGHRHMLRVVVVLRVLLGAAAGVVVAIVVVVDGVEEVCGDDAVEVARVAVELGKLHFLQRQLCPTRDAFADDGRCRLGLPTGPDSTHWSNRSAEQTGALVALCVAQRPTPANAFQHLIRGGFTRRKEPTLNGAPTLNGRDVDVPIGPGTGSMVFHALECVGFDWCLVLGSKVKRAWSERWCCILV
jgi:hypothetical protein